MSVDVPRTFGALMVGGIVAAVFSGVVTSQAFAYFKQYPDDAPTVKAIVGVVWGLDFWHTIFVTISLWYHLIEHFTEPENIDYIPWSLAMTIAFTATLTFLVHLFFVHRIFKLSHNNYYLAIPLGIIAVARLAFACLTTVTMITLKSLKLFVERYTWSFTTGLTLSAVLDVLITGLLCYLLLKSQKSNSSMNHILDKLMLYAFENGSLTCAATVVSLICWLAMPENLIFMGLHFVISKFYANSLLATLNKRRVLQAVPRSQQSGSGGNLAIMFPDSFGLTSRKTRHESHAPALSQVHIKVDQTKMSVTDGAGASDLKSESPQSY
ncbi:hypothetical protein NLJ89_g465 [Agrocybe chaxingu]|uniref:DUF6534 domain-containing protein n=1 Tax=Agrocybe chaxingu TaxID=84603 RepID=A0A9W8TF33_9AGAR|nr:hypothetical protein NLJ89_g465 [Agrocybe chaxingu]